MCLKKNFASSRQKFENLPFYLKPYVYMMPGSHVPFTGLDLRYQYNTFKKLKFRLKNMNQNVCPERTEFLANSPCNPRCVVIDRSNSLPIPGLLDNLSFLTYDCEVGFYISGKDDQKSWIETSGDDYLLSVCADGSSGTVCGEYTFQVPSPLHLNKTDDPPVIVLLDKQEFENKDKIVIYVPTSQKADTFSVSVLLVSDNQSSTVVSTQENPIPPGAGPVLKILVEHNIPSGRYQIAVTPKRGGELTGTPSYSAHLTRLLKSLP
ncbi:uncharacterized protein LOC111695520 [Eurytemora carolleeae]|uniref:uncharacterized protein LOC111695520 n=1 Tax=Eurytemora carolleeae TaxID=1294199 RepID=UPI000C77881A|nr:uncharacterized protein LOC111695520 [Eurytemora carolleeae]|eukprot:XP_023320656.1 uncharacterized protein LOC111695520 [Eurytemora affinis]